jgi:hypothetical protein
VTMSEAGEPSRVDAGYKRVEAAYRRMLPGLVASWVLLLLFCAVLIAKRPGGWHTGLLVWGIGVGLGAVLYSSVSVQLVTSFFGVSGDEKAEAIRRRRSSVQQKVSFLSEIVMGLTIGVISATTGVMWFDVAFTAFFLLTLVLTFLKARTFRAGLRRRAEAGTDD